MPIEEFVKGEWVQNEERERFYKANPLEKRFFYWISQYPESFHNFDMERFYRLAKCFCRYKRKNKNSSWLREKNRFL